MQLHECTYHRYTYQPLLKGKVLYIIFQSRVYFYVYLAVFINYLESCPCVRESSNSIELCAGAALTPCDCSGGSGCQVCV